MHLEKSIPDRENGQGSSGQECTLFKEPSAQLLEGAQSEQGERWEEKQAGEVRPCGVDAWATGRTLVFPLVAGH